MPFSRPIRRTIFTAGLWISTAWPVVSGVEARSMIVIDVLTSVLESQKNKHGGRDAAAYDQDSQRWRARAVIDKEVFSYFI